MAEAWTISVGGRVFGPYDLEQLRSFRTEKRLAEHSLVARAGQEQFHPAGEDPELACLFQADAEMAPSSPAVPVQPRSFGARLEADAGTPGHFVIVADMKTLSMSGLEEAIFSLGTAHRFGPSAWVLSSEASINTVRTALVQKLGKQDTLFLVDAARDKAAWFNFGPEADARIRRIWSRPTEHLGTEKRAVRRT